jgi:hypothetical protein
MTARDEAYFLSLPSCCGARRVVSEVRLVCVFCRASVRVRVAVCAQCDRACERAKAYSQECACMRT